MKISKFYGLILGGVAFGLIGCASSSPKSQTVTSTASVAVPTLPAEAYQSFRRPSDISYDICSANERSLQKTQQPRLVRIANGCVKSQKWDALKVVANSLSQQYPNSPWGAYYLSLASEKQKQYPRALWMVDAALKKSPKEAMLHYQKGRIYWMMNENTAALASFQESLKYNPQFVDSLLFLAQVHYRNQNFKVAEKYFATVLEIEKDNSEAFAGLTESKQALEKGEKRKLVSK